MIERPPTPQQNNPEFMQRRPLLRFACALAALPVALLASEQQGHAQSVSTPKLAAVSSVALASPWVKGHSFSVRLIAGALPPAGAQAEPKHFAGIELRMADGWKTYWRHPGDDGGIPPAFTWTGSRNLKSAAVRFPAPERIKSLNGTTLGYAKSVVFPVEITPENATLPVELNVALEFGVCREICVPAEAILRLTVPAAIATMPSELAAALQRVPKPLPEGSAVLKSAKAVLTGPAPNITFDIASGSANARTDLFVESSGGSYLPVPQKVGDPVQGIQRFRVDLKGVDEIAALAGKPLRLTITTPGAPVELTWTAK